VLTITWTREWRRRLVVSALMLVVVLTAVALGGAPRQGLAPSLPQPLRSVPVAGKMIALTFDISWGTVMPPKVLAVLEQEKVPATFFLSGPWAQHHADFVRRLAAAGFQVESHGQAHVNYSGLTDAQVAENLRQAGTILQGITGRRVDMVRPPNGDYDRRTLRVAGSLGYTVVLWDTDSLDWLNPGVARIVERVLRRAHPGDIVLLHASDTCKQTDLALPSIIAGLRRQGYRFVTLDQLLSAPRSTPAAVSARLPVPAGTVGA
jgi:polysaccharide deacetylase family sporulation protein PdaB